MKSTLFSVISLLFAASPAFAITFEEFQVKYGRSYAPEEVALRQMIFDQNSAFIDAFNLNSLGHTLEINEFADYTVSEYRQMTGRSTTIPPKEPTTPGLHRVDTSGLPKSVDWRESNAVTPVKNQGQCGSCWAFSTTGAVEGIHAIKTGKLVSLSEEQLVCCSSENNGCGGGLMDRAFEYVEKHGLTTEKDYPYDAAEGTCATNWTEVVKIKGYEDVPANDQQALMAAVARQPVSVAIEADKSAFQFYSGGVIRSGCGTQLDHGVLLVGYGTEDSTDYWLVKNSWGPNWGDEGYVKLLRTNSTTDPGMCGIALTASYPTL